MSETSRGIGYQELGGGHIPRLCLPGTLAMGDSVYQKGSKFNCKRRSCPLEEDPGNC